MRILTVSIAAFCLSAVATAQVPCWEPSIGTNLGLIDDDDSPPQLLGFSFDYAGVSYTDIVICSNGYIWFGAVPGVPADYSPTVAELTTQGPRLAPLWNDFDPSATGSGNVHFASFPQSGSTPARAVITWDNVFEYQRTTPLSMQVTLTEGHEIFIHYDTNMTVVAGGFGAGDNVVGASDGAGTQNPVDFTNLPVVTNGSPTLHQLMPRGVFPLAGKDLQWLIDGSGGYIVIERSQCSAGTFLPYGVGCPDNMTAYEYFDAGTFDLSNTSLMFQATGTGGFVVLPGPGLDPSYSNAIVMADDDILAGQPLGFNFPFAGTTTAAVDLGANGIIWVGASGHPTGLINGYPTGGASLADEPVPVIAPLLMDLNPDPTTGAGTVYWDTTANFAMITWVDVPHFGLPGSVNTVQAKMFSNGDVVLSYGTASNFDVALVGISEGNNAAIPNPVDWTNVPVMVGLPNTLPIQLSAAMGSRPAIGQTFTMDVTNIPSGTVLGAMILSFGGQINPGMSLAAMGGGRCSQYVNLDLTSLLVISGSTASFSIPIANNTAYLGLNIFAQAATFSPGFNALGIVTSNGGQIRIGT